MVVLLGFILKKNKKTKIEKNVKKYLKEEEKFGIKNYKTYLEFGKKVYKIKEKVVKNIKELKNKNGEIIGYGSPAKATTALNFFGISKEINFVIEDNKLKIGKFIPGVNIEIKKKKLKDKDKCILVLAWNFFEEIKKNNISLSKNFINIKDLEKDL